MKTLLRPLGHLLVLICCTLLGREVYLGFHELPPLTWSLDLCLTLLAALGLYCLSHLLTSANFLLLLRGGDPQASPRQCLVIYGMPMIAKYLPGNVFHYVGRLALAKRYGIKSEAVIMASLYEGFLDVVSAVCLAACGLLWRAPQHLNLVHQPPLSLTLAIVVALSLGAAALARLPKVRHWLGRQWQQISLPRFALVLLCQGLAYLLFGGILYLLQDTFTTAGKVAWFDYSWGFALAWVVGFVVPGAPGGVGIREFLLLTLFAGTLGGSSATVLFLVMRLINILGDLALYCVAALLKRAEDRHLAGALPQSALS